MKTETLIEVTKASKKMGIKELDRCISDCDSALCDSTLPKSELKKVRKEKSVLMQALYARLTPGIIKPK